MQQSEPLPGCGFVIHTSPPHWSSTHHLHGDPPVATEHIVKTVMADGKFKPVGAFHTPFIGQTTLDMFGIK